MANSRGMLKRLRAKRDARGNGRAGIDYSEVTRVAYELYEQRGREDGRALDDWLQAERLVRQRASELGTVQR